jgi:hypothetical protein
MPWSEYGTGIYGIIERSLGKRKGDKGKKVDKNKS